MFFKTDHPRYINVPPTFPEKSRYRDKMKVVAMLITQKRFESQTSVILDNKALRDLASEIGSTAKTALGALEVQCGDCKPGQKGNDGYSTHAFCACYTELYKKMVASLGATREVERVINQYTGKNAEEKVQIGLRAHFGQINSKDRELAIQ